jgi:large subunit ribosomal protein L31e
MAKKTETKTEKLEREYVIPLRNKWKRVPRYKRANKAIKAIKEFVAKHMKIRDRDLKKIKVDKYLNEEVWFRGIKKPPARIKVKAVKEGEIVTVELFEMHKNLKFKKAREEKREKKSIEIAEGKAKKEEKPEEKVEEKTEEKKEEEKEKKAAVVEAGQKMEKESAKKVKHQTKQSKQPKRQQRKTLAK